MSRLFLLTSLHAAHRARMALLISSSYLFLLILAQHYSSVSINLVMPGREGGASFLASKWNRLLMLLIASQYRIIMPLTSQLCAFTDGVNHLSLQKLVRWSLFIFIALLHCTYVGRLRRPLFFQFQLRHCRRLPRPPPPLCCCSPLSPYVDHSRCMMDCNIGKVHWKMRRRIDTLMIIISHPLNNL